MGLVGQTLQQFWQFLRVAFWNSLPAFQSPELAGRYRRRGLFFD